MANKEQVKRLLAGVEGWNKWRVDNLVDIDLTEADLHERYLHGALLWKVNLKEADLRKTNLEEAKLYKADLCNADLVEANLKKAGLMHADLRGANLEGANLKGADLTEADLSRANLRKANLSGVEFFSTALNHIDLRETDGLEEIQHHGASFIDIGTLQLSKGEIPLKFLRGIGLSDWEIESAKLYQPGLDSNQIVDITYKVAQILIGNPLQYSSCFISHSHKDQSFAQKLYDNLQDSGVRCWFAPEDVQGGKKLYEQIDAAIQTRERLLLILSDDSMNSEWVKTEIANARQKEIKEKRQVLFPISIVDFEKIKEWKCFDADTGKDSAREIREYFIPDFSQWEEKKEFEPAFKRLLEDLRK
jgi:uncharacterized protein YjbI with pentapeptide repeats